MWERGSVIWGRGFRGMPPEVGDRVVLAFGAPLIILLAIVFISAPPCVAAKGCTNEAIRAEQTAFLAQQGEREHPGTPPPSLLPGCRAYELVSLPYQPSPSYELYYNGFPPTEETHLRSFNEAPNSMPEAEYEISTAIDGNAALFSSRQPNSEGDAIKANLSRRGPDGWIGENIIPMRSRHSFLCNLAFPTGFTPNFERIAIDIGESENGRQAADACGHAEPPLAPGESEEMANLFVRDTATRTFQLVNTTPMGRSFDPNFDAISADGGHVIFQSRAQLTPGAVNGETVDNSITAAHCTSDFGNVYVWSQGVVRLLTVLPAGTPVRGTLASAHPVLCGGIPNQSTAFTHAVSADGERVLFYAGGGFEHPSPFPGEEVRPNAPYIDGGLYLREHPGAEQSALNECTEAEEKAEPEKACTVQIDAPAGGSGKGGGGQFQWADAETSKVFFTDEERLTPDSTAQVGKPDLYEYDLEKPRGQRLADLTVNAPEPAGVLGLSGASEDGSYVYFVATGVLTTSQENSHGAKAAAGEANLYMRHADTTTFVAALNAAGGDQCDWTAACLTARVSQNGLFIAFDSLNSLTGYDNHPVRPEACEYLTLLAASHPCMETFRYAAASGVHGELTCASCNPGGAPPASEFAWSVIRQARHGETAVKSGSMSLDHPLSNSGQVFFETMEKLVPADGNKTWDVYEYEGGEGTSAQLQLISSGGSEQPSYFEGASADGSNVFFVTFQPLLRADTRTDYDLYDARVNGGFPESPPPPSCKAEEGCRGVAAPAPVFSAPGSASFEGAGNVHEVLCAKGFLRRNGRCVKQKHNKHKKQRRKHTERHRHHRRGARNSRMVPEMAHRDSKRPRHHRRTARRSRRIPNMTMPHRAARAALALVCALAAWLVLACSPAGARVIHNSEGSFDGHETAAGRLEWVQGIAADNSGGPSAGHVYVWQFDIFTTGESTVYKFDKNGKLDASFGDTEANGEPKPNGELSGKKTPQGSFGSLLFSSFRTSRVAVDGSAGARGGDLYVADIAHGVIDRFSESGAFQCQITARPATSRSAGEAAAECNGVAGSEVPGAAPIEPTGVAVDSANGNLYVADAEHNAVDEFNEAGAYMGQITDSHISEPSAVALDPGGSGHLYVLDGGTSGTFGTEVVELSLAGVFERAIAQGEEPKDIALDPVSTHLYVQANHGTGSEEFPHRIEEYDSTGRLVSSFAGNVEQGEGPLAVGSGGRVYRGPLLKERVDMYSPDVVVPTVTTQAATGLQETSAPLHGHLDPDAADGGGDVLSCQFEYGPTKAYGETAPCVPFGPYTGPQDVSATLEGLRPQSTYHFRLEAANANMFPSTGEDETFTTSGPPSIDRQAAEGGTSWANFRAHINPWGHDTTCQLQYVSDASFQASQWAGATTVPCSPEDLGSGFGDVTVKARVTGLARASTYHYRFVASNQAGLFGHPGGTFETYGIRKFSVQFLKSSNITVNGGLEHWEAGEPETLRAGAHPYELVTTVTFSETTLFSHCVSSVCEERKIFGEETEKVNYTGLNTKDIRVDLPPGLIGNPSALPKCNRYLVEIGQCPADTQVGMIEVFADNPLAGPSEVAPLLGEFEQEPCTVGMYCEPLYILEPSEKAPAEFAGFIEGQAPAWIPFHVRTGGDYGVSADSINITSLGGGIQQVRVRVWGVPASPAHEIERSCPLGSTGPCPDTEPQKPLLINPTSCAGPQTVTARADSWQEPGHYVKQTTELPGFTGCDKLQFKPTLELAPTTNVADSPTGLHVDLHVPQDVNSKGFEEPNGLATADLKDTKVVLPPGLIANPAAANGLGACSPGQIELHGPEPAHCPDAAKIGEVEVDSPLVSEELGGRVVEREGRPVPRPLKGAVYVATPYDNPFDSLLAIYVAVYDPKTGIVVKLAGHIEANPETGQLTTTFDETPQLPFEDFKLDFFGGPRATLRTPATCGAYESISALTPWSAPESGPLASWASPFSVNSAPGGGSCPASATAEPNRPSFAAGTETPLASSYSPFAMSLHREDDSQELKGISTVLPPGLTAKLAGVAECSDAAIAAAEHRTGRQEQESPSCPAGSEIGTVSVGAGAGPAPYFTQGRIYFAGPYKGGPFSLAIVTPAVAGPYDLGTVVVRAALHVDPHTAQVTVESDPIPTILQGIPLDVRTIAVRVGRPGFTLNPTSCERMMLTGQALSVLGQSAALGSPFQVGGCTVLPFHPKFSVLIHARHTRRDGEYMHVTVQSNQGQANIGEVHVTLPKALPSRLSTLKLACSENQFAKDPAGCPAGSFVGTAIARTPVLSKPLTGPAIFVSHGGAGFPDLDVVIQAEGVTIDLTGNTNIRNGITSSTFAAVPDVPVNRFDLILPTGEHSALAAQGDLCYTTVTKRVRTRARGVNTRQVRQRRRLVMPTTITGHNGKVLQQNTPIGVSGCSKSKAKQPRKHHKRRHRHR